MSPIATQSSGSHTSATAATTAPAVMSRATERAVSPDARRMAATAIGIIALG